MGTDVVTEADNRPKKDSGSDRYKATLNLPQTEFSMRAGLPEREPKQVEKWLADSVYAKMVEGNRKSGKGPFLLHDGPPYANGNIHIGHTLNKVLKDVVIKYKNLRGYEAAYIPGWDCHGLPIELGVEKQLLDEKKDKNTLPATELRELCRKYAQKYVELQSQQFQRLEVFGDWGAPYRTMDQAYVASIVRQLGMCAENGFLYKGNKPVHWCPSCATALAEAEIEYADKTSPSIYVKFDLTQEALASFPELAAVAKREGASRVSIVIWTTTPWTLPANLGIALHPEHDYSAIKVPGLEGTEIWISAQELQPALEKVAGFEKPSTPLLIFKAEKLHRQKARHPFIARDSLIMLGEHVTLDTGTGAVHTAPGHGVDDFRIGKKYGLEILAPVDDRGRFNTSFEEMKGQFIFKTNAPIIEKLRSSGHLVSAADVQHSYPHCWRCHQAVIFRATPQWFIGMDGPGQLRSKAMKAIDEVEWIPGWGINRIKSMIESRPDWCVSRQRLWGVPITVFYCEDCNEPLASRSVFDHVASLIDQSGTDIWFSQDAQALVPPGAKCGKCSGTKFKKEKDILDVWFDSGVSHAAVCEARGLGWPADLYLEGSDQHRGWFQTSLLTGVATRGRAPFKAVLTHGFVNDRDGKKMSKSKGNVTSPLDIMKTHGAEILRLWVVFEDYRDDVNFSKESLERVTESYRKIRNTVRFLLGNLADFDPTQHKVPLAQLGELDRWALSRTAEVLSQIEKAYDQYEFHRVYQEVVNFCVVELSSTYLDILKDRLYTAAKESQERRSSQTALYEITRAILLVLSPILSFTAEEAWGYLPKGSGTPHPQESIFLAARADGDIFDQAKTWRDERVDRSYELVWASRTAVLKALEEARQAKKIGHPREASVQVTASVGDAQGLQSIRENLARLYLVSKAKLGSKPDIATGTFGVQVDVAGGSKCARCWVYTEEVGTHAQHPELCDRCNAAVAGLSC